MRLLLISNSTNPGEAYLDYPKEEIRKFLGKKPVEALFIPYAAVTFSYEVYENKVNERFAEIGHRVRSIHHFDNPQQAVAEAQAIVVGGGNTWKLVSLLQQQGLIEIIRRKALEGSPYIGWSAGSNIACPSLRTTNDMPITEPASFETCGLVPFQINPHYLDDHPKNHGGETREMRIQEFITENPEVYVLGLREGSMLRLEDGKLRLIGKRSLRLFKAGEEARELSEQDSLDFLLA